MALLSVKRAAIAAAVLALGLATVAAEAKDKVKVGFIGPLSGGTSSNGTPGMGAPW